MALPSRNVARALVEKMIAWANESYVSTGGEVAIVSGSMQVRTEEGTIAIEVAPSPDSPPVPLSPEEAPTRLPGDWEATVSIQAADAPPVQFRVPTAWLRPAEPPPTPPA